MKEIQIRILQMTINNLKEEYQISDKKIGELIDNNLKKVKKIMAGEGNGNKYEC